MSWGIGVLIDSPVLRITAMSNNDYFVIMLLLLFVYLSHTSACQCSYAFLRRDCVVVAVHIVYSFPFYVLMATDDLLGTV